MRSFKNVKALFALIATCGCILGLIGCEPAKKQSDHLPESSSTITQSEIEIVKKQQAVQEIIDRSAKSSSVEPMSKEEQLEMAERLGQALVSGEPTRINDAFFGKGKAPHTYDMGLTYPFEDISGFECTDYSVEYQEKIGAVITLEVQATGKTPLKEGQHSYALSFASGGDSAFERGSVTMMLPVEKYIGHDLLEIETIENFRYWVTTDSFESSGKLYPYGAVRYLFYMMGEKNVPCTCTGSELAKAGEIYLGLEDFAPKDSANGVSCSYNAETDSYSLPQTDGDFVSGIGVRAVAVTKNEAGGDGESGLLEVTFETYLDGLCLEPNGTLTYSLQETKTENGDVAYAILSCKQG